MFIFFTLSIFCAILALVEVMHRDD
jgi:hypothetical protein